MAVYSASTSELPESDAAARGSLQGADGDRTGTDASPSDPLANAVEAVERHAVLVLCALLFVSGALLMYMGRHLTFFYDEWEWILHDYGGGIHWMLLAHVGNISFWPAAIYKAWFHLVGLDHYAVFRLEVVLLHLTCGALVYVLAARRIPRLPALLAATLILFLGVTWEDLFWGFQVGYMLSVAGGLGALALLDGRSRLPRDLAVLLCLIVSAGSSSLGIPIMIGVFVELIRTPAGRRRLWIVLIPMALYVLWYLTHGTSQVTEESLLKAPSFAEDLAAAVFGGLFGQGLDWGQPLAVAGVAILLYCLIRRPPITPRLGGLLVAAIALWAVIAAARSTISIPEESRYIYLGAVLIVLVGVELLRGIEIAPRASVVVAVPVAIAALTGVILLHNGAKHLTEVSQTVGAELGALEVGAAYAPPGYQPDPKWAPPVYAGLYLHTVRSIGSTPADAPAQILSAEASARTAADAVLMTLEGPTLSRPGGAAPLAASAPTLTALYNGTQSKHGACVRITQLPSGPMNAELVLPASGLIVRDEGSAPTALAARRFSETFSPLTAHIDLHDSATISVRPDAQEPRIPWLLRLASSSPLTLCAVAGS